MREAVATSQDLRRAEEENDLAKGHLHHQGVLEALAVGRTKTKMGK